MMNRPINRQHIAASISTLPPFPRIVNEILATIDDPDANLNVLTALIRRDPVIAARILSQANVAGSRGGHRAPLCDIYPAMSLIGLSQVRKTVLTGYCRQIVDGLLPAEASSAYWQHSVAVGVCCEELAFHVALPVSSTSALIAGLLHDIGQLWLRYHHPYTEPASWASCLAGASSITEAEYQHFGTDHGQVGAWLAGEWSLPDDIVAAIRHHHERDPPCDMAVVPVLHVAEVLANALDLTGRPENRVTGISAHACHHLGVAWNDDIRPLFGRIEARSRHANAFFA